MPVPWRMQMSLIETRTEPVPDQGDIKSQRARAVKTAWLLAIVVSLIFIAFILSGVLGEAG